MKQEKGITIVSVIVYVIIALIIIATLSVLSQYFHKSIQTTFRNNEDSKKYVTFMSYFIQDIQEKGNGVVDVGNSTNVNGDEVNYIQFTNGNTYKYDINNKILYKNNIKIAENLNYCNFTCEMYKETNYKIQVDFYAGNFKKIGKNKALTFYMMQV